MISFSLSISFSFASLFFLVVQPPGEQRAMPVDEGDDERWAELPGGSSSSSSSDDSEEGEDAIVDHI